MRSWSWQGFLFIVAVWAIGGLVACTSRPAVTRLPTATPTVAAIKTARLARLGKGTANHIAWSPDGRLLGVSSSLGIYLYDAETLQPVRLIETDAWETMLSFSPDGKVVASLSDQGIRMWRVASGDLSRVQEGRGISVTSIAFSPSPRPPLSPPRNQGAGGESEGGGTLLAVGTIDGSVRLRDTEDGILLQQLKGHQGAVTDLAFSPDGTLLASGAEDGEVRLWRVSDGSPLKMMRGHTGAVTGLAFSADGGELASASWDVPVWFWNVEGCGGSAQPCGESLFTLGKEMAGELTVIDIALSPAGPFMAVGTSNGMVQVWGATCPVRTPGGCWSLLNVLEGHRQPITGVAFAPDGSVLASVSEGGLVYLWGMQGCIDHPERCGEASVRSVPGHTTQVKALAFAPGGETLAAGMEGGQVQVWQAVAPGAMGGYGAPPVREEWTLVSALEGHVGAVFGVAFSPDGQMLASVGDDNAIRVWRAGDGTLLRTLKGHAWLVSSVAFAPDGTLLASGSCDKTVRLWRSSDGTLLGSLAHPDWVWSVAFAPDGTLLATGSQDGRVRLWQMPGGDLLRTLEGHAGAVLGVAFAPDGKTLASGSSDGTVRLWSVAEGGLLRTLAGHRAEVTGVAFAPGGKTLASSSADRTARLWRVEDGLLAGTLMHRAPAQGVAFAGDGTLLAVGVQDGTVQLWQVEGR